MITFVFITGTKKTVCFFKARWDTHIDRYHKGHSTRSPVLYIINLIGFLFMKNSMLLSEKLYKSSLSACFVGRDSVRSSYFSGIFVLIMIYVDFLLSSRVSLISATAVY